MTQRQKINKEVKRVVNVLVKKYHPLKIVLFGSVARAGAHECNDIDLFIVKDDVQECGFDRQYDVDRIVDRRGIGLDFLVYRSDEVKERLKLGDPFIKEIVKNGKVLYGR